MTDGPLIFVPKQGSEPDVMIGLSSCRRIFIFHFIIPILMLSMKTVGKRKVADSPWDGFDRLQRSVETLTRGRRCPRGVYKFKTFEDFEAWKWRIIQRNVDSQMRET